MNWPLLIPCPSRKSWSLIFIYWFYLFFHSKNWYQVLCGLSSFKFTWAADTETYLCIRYIVTTLFQIRRTLGISLDVSKINKITFPICLNFKGFLLSCPSPLLLFFPLLFSSVLWINFWEAVLCNLWTQGGRGSPLMGFWVSINRLKMGASLWYIRCEIFLEESLWFLAVS